MGIYKARVTKALVWGVSAVCALDAAMRHEGLWRLVFATLAVFNIASTADVFSQRFDRAEREEA